MGTARNRHVAEAHVPEDIRGIVTCALDLAYYRKQHPDVAEDLARAVYHELRDRVETLPERELDREGMGTVGEGATLPGVLLIAGAVAVFVILFVFLVT